MGSNPRQTPRATSIRAVAGGSMVAAVAMLAAVIAPLGGLGPVGPSPLAAQVLPAADLQLAGSVEEAPPGAGITTGDAMVYDLTIRNGGPEPIPAQSLLLTVFVGLEGAAEPVAIEVAQFGDGSGLQPAGGGPCGNGRHLVVQCTNRQALGSGEEISLRLGHRHPEPVAGAMSFVAEVAGSRNLFADPDAANNSFQGPTYGFLNPPTTTATTAPSTTTTTTASTTSSIEDTSTTDTTEPTSTSSSTTSSSTTTTTPTTTTTAPSTTATASTTSSTSTPVSTTSTTIAALSGSGSLPTSSSVQGVEGSAGNPDDQLLAGPTAEQPSGGPPFLLLAALGALVILLGGIGLGLYVHVNRPPPLVDIRRFD